MEEHQRIMVKTSVSIVSIDYYHAKMSEVFNKITKYT